MKRLYRAFRFAFENGLKTFLGVLRGNVVMVAEFSDGNYPKDDKDLYDALEMSTLLLNIYGLSKKEADRVRVNIIESRMNCPDKV